MKLVIKQISNFGANHGQFEPKREVNQGLIVSTIVTHFKINLLNYVTYFTLGTK